MKKIILIILFAIYSIISFSQSYKTVINTLHLDIKLVNLENCNLQTKRRLPNHKKSKSYTIFLDNYSISTTEITIRQFIIFLNNSNIDSTGFINNELVIGINDNKCPIKYNGKTKKFYFNSSKVITNEECPIVDITQFGAMEFCKWLTNLTNNYYRLPTEAEWEYAAKGNTNYIYSGSNCLDSVGWYKSNSASKIHKTGLKPPNTFGLYDMSGNIAEWCLDTDNAKLKGDSIKNPICINGWNAIIKGGSYNDFMKQCTINNISYQYSLKHNLTVGFRIVCTDTLMTIFHCFEAPPKRRDYQMKNGKRMRKSFNPDIQFDFGKTSSVNIGISRNWTIFNGGFLPEYQHGLFINIGMGTFKNSFISQFGYQFYYGSIINSKISVVNYTYSRKNYSYLRPEIGISFLSLITFSYGYNVSLQKNDITSLNGNIFTLKFSYPIWDKEKMTRNKNYITCRHN